MAKVTAFDVFSRMSVTDNKRLELAPLSNILNMRKVKAGTQVTIGVGGNDVLMRITMGEVVGGLILCDKAEFDRVKAEMEAEG